MVAVKSMPMGGMTAPMGPPMGGPMGPPPAAPAQMPNMGPPMAPPNAGPQPPMPGQGSSQQHLAVSCLRVLVDMVVVRSWSRWI